MPDDQKDVLIRVRVCASEWEVYKATAEAADMDVSRWLRTIARRAARMPERNGRK